MIILVTGGAGFIGSNFIRYVLHERPEWKVVNYDLLTYAGNLANLADADSKENYEFVRGDISNASEVDRLFKRRFDFVVNFAAETHVDRSLYDPGRFLSTNIVGTEIMLRRALKADIKRFLHISTDEVYGSLEDGGGFSEDAPLRPNSPYAASKASADLVCRAYFKTFDLPVIIVRPGNNYGPYQFPEKLIPLFVTRALEDEKLPLYGDGLNIRDWLFVEDCCRGIYSVLRDGRDGETYNISARCQKTNLEITRSILRILGKPEDLISFVKDRPGHDRRYGLNCDRIKSELGWHAAVDFDTGLERTVSWYRANRTWWEKIKSGEYRQFYELHYKDRQ